MLVGMVPHICNPSLCLPCARAVGFFFFLDFFKITFFMCISTLLSFATYSVSICMAGFFLPSYLQVSCRYGGMGL